MDKSKMGLWAGLVLVVIGVIIAGYALFGPEGIPPSTKEIGYGIMTIGLLILIAIGNRMKKEDKGGS